MVLGLVGMRACVLWCGLARQAFVVLGHFCFGGALFRVQWEAVGSSKRNVLLIS